MVSLGQDCEVGLRRRTYNVVSGSVLSVWSRVEGVLASKNGTHNNKMQVIRLRTKDDLKIVGRYSFDCLFLHWSLLDENTLFFTSAKCVLDFVNCYS